MKPFALFVGLAISLITATSYAASDIPLSNQTLGPNQDLSISLATLAPGVSYDVSCVINNDRKTSDANIMLQTNVTCYSLNNAVTCRGPQLSLPTNVGPVVFKVEGISGDLGSLTFRNMDSSATVTLANCAATVHQVCPPPAEKTPPCHKKVKRHRIVVPLCFDTDPCCTGCFAH